MLCFLPVFILCYVSSVVERGEQQIFRSSQKLNLIQIDVYLIHRFHILGENVIICEEWCTEAITGLGRRIWNAMFGQGEESKQNRESIQNRPYRLYECMTQNATAKIIQRAMKRGNGEDRGPFGTTPISGGGDIACWMCNSSGFLPRIRCLKHPGDVAVFSGENLQLIYTDGYVPGSGGIASWLRCRPQT